MYNETVTQQTSLCLRYVRTAAGHRANRRCLTLAPQARAWAELHATPGDIEGIASPRPLTAVYITSGSILKNRDTQGLSR